MSDTGSDQILQDFIQLLTQCLPAGAPLPPPTTPPAFLPQLPPVLLQSFLSSQLPQSSSATSSPSVSSTSLNDSIASIDSGYSSTPPNFLMNMFQPTQPSTRSTPQRIRQRPKRDFCKVCRTTIAKEGCRSQGPRRHIMQHHLMQPHFHCPLCKFSSNYDKAHVHAHMRRMHPGRTEEAQSIQKNFYQREERLWMEACFGANSDGSIPAGLAENKENQQQEYSDKEEEHSDSNDVKPDLQDLHSFSISNILSEGDSSQLNSPRQVL